MLPPSVVTYTYNPSNATVANVLKVQAWATHRVVSKNNKRTTAKWYGVSFRSDENSNNGCTTLNVLKVTILHNLGSIVN